MSKLPTYAELSNMSDEEIAAMNRQMTKVALRNIAIFAGVKIAIAYGLHRWAKAAAKNA